MRTKVVNFYAGPGTGKSTTAAALFAELKYRGVNCEYVQEVAKWATWERRGEKFFKDQVKIFGEQQFKHTVLRGEVDIIITDSPLHLGLVYQPDDYPLTELRGLMWQVYSQSENLDIFLERDLARGYNPLGRNQDYDEALYYDNRIRTMMKTVLPYYETLKFSRETPQQVIDLMLGRNWQTTIPKLTNV